MQTHYQQPIGMQNMLLPQQQHRIIEAPPTGLPSFVPPLLRLCKHNSQGTSYYRSLARTLGEEPVIVAHEGNSHKGTKLGPNDLLRLIVFFF